MCRAMPRLAGPGHGRVGFLCLLDSLRQHREAITG
jgi:hypothetical protein